MTDDHEKEAAEAAKQARGQAKAAAKNTSRAVRAVSEDVTDKAEDTAEDALNAARRVNPKIISKISGDTGIGFLALSVSIYSGTIAFYKFRQAFAGSKRITGA